MKKVFKGVAAVAVAFAVCVVAGCGAGNSAIEREAQAYADRVLPQICGSWSSMEIMLQASPEFFASVPGKQLEQAFSLFKDKLGTLTQYRGSVGKLELRQEKVVTAIVKARGAFQKAEGEMTVRVIKRDGVWKIIELNVKSDALH